MHGYGLSHSVVEMRPRINSKTETPTYAPPKYIQTSIENGDMKENVEGGSFCGFRYRIEIPATLSLFR